MECDVADCPKWIELLITQHSHRYHANVWHPKQILCLRSHAHQHKELGFRHFMLISSVSTKQQNELPSCQHSLILGNRILKLWRLFLWFCY